MRHVQGTGNSARPATRGSQSRENLPAMQRGRGSVDLLNAAEAMEYLRISRKTLDRACEQYRQGKGGLRYEQRSAGSHRRFRLADLDRWSTGTETRRLRAAS